MAAAIPNRMQRHWSETRNFLQREWPRLTDVDLDEIDGEYDRLIHRIRQLYRAGDEIQIEGGIKTKIQRFLNGLDNI